MCVCVGGGGGGGAKEACVRCGHHEPENKYLETAPRPPASALGEPRRARPAQRHAYLPRVRHIDGVLHWPGHPVPVADEVPALMRRQQLPHRRQGNGGGRGGHGDGVAEGGVRQPESEGHDGRAGVEAMRAAGIGAVGAPRRRAHGAVRARERGRAGAHREVEDGDLGQGTFMAERHCNGAQAAAVWPQVRCCGTVPRILPPCGSLCPSRPPLRLLLKDPRGGGGGCLGPWSAPADLPHPHQKNFPAAKNAIYQRSRKFEADFGYINLASDHLWVWWLALLACGGAYWPLAFESSAMTSRHPYYCGHPPAWGGGESRMQLLPMAFSPDGLISARYAVITKTPGWEVLTTTSNVNFTQGDPPPRGGFSLSNRPCRLHVQNNTAALCMKWDCSRADGVGLQRGRTDQADGTRNTPHTQTRAHTHTQFANAQHKALLAE